MQPKQMNLKTVMRSLGDGKAFVFSDTSNTGAPDISGQLETMLEQRKHRTTLEGEVARVMAAYYAGTNLAPYVNPLSGKEDMNKYKDRQAKAVLHYDNYPKEISRKYVQGIYRAQTVVRKIADYNADDAFQARLNDYLNGAYDRFWRREIAAMALVMPELFIRVVRPEPGFVPLSLQQEEMYAEIPHPCVVYPQHVINFGKDRDGNIEWIAIQCHKDTVEILTEEWGYVIEGTGKGAKIVKTYLHGFKRCPVVRMCYAENHAYEGCIGMAYLQEVVSLSLATLQLTSAFIEMVEGHLFYKLVMGARTAQNLVANGMGNFAVVTEEEDEKNTTRYVGIPATELDKMIDIRFERMPQRMYSVAHLRNPNTNSGRGRVNMSGFAIMLDAVPESDALAEVSDYYQGADEAVCDLIAEGYGPGTLTVTTNYPSTFGAKNVASMLSDFASFISLLKEGNVPYSDTAHREIVNLLYTKLWFTDADNDLKMRITKELEAWKSTTVEKLNEAQGGEGDGAKSKDAKTTEDAATDDATAEVSSDMAESEMPMHQQMKMA